MAEENVNLHAEEAEATESKATKAEKTKGEKKGEKLPPAERARLIERLTEEMKEASRMLEFEKAAFLRDRIRDLRTTK